MIALETFCVCLDDWKYDIRTKEPQNPNCKDFSWVHDNVHYQCKYLKYEKIKNISSKSGVIDHTEQKSYDVQRIFLKNA